ncbi:MAG: hypothetical protein DRQ39_06000 [Gammaproteobacteria bacterium]|nr:MAG: hypothetical protein DRQ39_06000 [Gammaproteobacteria bacterium]RKZ93732.1 MAG: hypothetical protein DRQ40_07300 [Gammaproteobacteria bacterium]
MKPYVQVFKIPSSDGPIELAAIVVDQEEFNALVDEIVKVSLTMGIDEAMGERIKEAAHIPMVARGLKTAFLFERFGVKGDRLSVIVRGQGQSIAAQLFVDPELN